MIYSCMDFPIFKTKIKGLETKFDLTDPKGQKDYFAAKAGEEIEKLKAYLKKDIFISFFLGKKNSGKGTYSKMFAEIAGSSRVEHFSVGDMIRGLDEVVADASKKKELLGALEKTYRGWVPLERIVKSLEQRDTKSLLPSELILALIREEMRKKEKKAVFFDGFPRTADQFSYALFLRDIIGCAQAPDLFILIDVPTSVIDERIKWRRVCPVDQTSRNLKLLTTPKVGYREDTKEFYLICDHPEHGGREVEMVAKEGDELGTAPIQERIAMDEKLMEQASSLQGIPRIMLRNTVPASSVKEYVDDYEITPEYVYEWDEKEKKVRTTEKPWVVSDTKGAPSYSLLPQAVVVSLIKQLVQVLDI